MRRIEGENQNFDGELQVASEFEKIGRSYDRYKAPSQLQPPAPPPVRSAVTTPRIRVRTGGQSSQPHIRVKKPSTGGTGGGDGPRVRVKRQPKQVQQVDQELAMVLRQRAAEARAKLHELCRSDINAFCEYVLIDDKTGRAVEQSQFHCDLQTQFDRHREIVVMSHPESGKALLLDTEIPSPDGWTTMGDLRVGDRVYGRDGKPCSVIFATETQYGHRVFEVEFEDGTSIRADADHQWLVQDATTGKRSVVTTEILSQNIWHEREFRWAVPVAEPVWREHAPVVVDPYILGMWLGGAELHALHPSLLLQQQLSELGIDEHLTIPQAYLCASVAQRTSLLVGMLEAQNMLESDTRELTFKTFALAETTAELARSLGHHVSLGPTCSMWAVKFAQHGRMYNKDIVSIVEVETAPVRCIQVDSSDRTYLVGRAYTVTHNTNQAIGRVLYELGNNPNLRVMILYNAEDSAMKTLATLRRYIESSAELRSVFPALKRGEIWKDDQVVVQRLAFSRDPSVVAVGYNSRRIQGTRVDLLIVDDLLDALVTATESQRRKLSSWVKNTVLTRLTEKAKVMFLTNAWHPRDLAHELVKDRGWHLLRRPIRNPDGKIWWRVWSEERLARLKKSLGELEYARSFNCDPRDDGSRVFRPEHVEFAQKRGVGYGFIEHIELMPDDCLVVTGVDLAAALDDAKSTGAKTVVTSVFFHPNGDRQVIRIRAGRWRAVRILQELTSVGAAFPHNHWIVVENNGVQRWILELAGQNHVDVGVALVPFQTGKNKADPRFGVSSMAAEFEIRKWILPASCYSEEEQAHVSELVADMIDYVPEAHTGDYLMSLWFAREVGRRIFKRVFGEASSDGDRKSGGGSSVRAIG